MTIEVEGKQCEVDPTVAVWPLRNNSWAKANDSLHCLEELWKNRRGNMIQTIMCEETKNWME
jgi:hypothetical protein